MTSNIRGLLFAMLLVTIAAFSVSGCGGSSTPPAQTSVTISPATPQTVVENTSVTFTATVNNDPTNSGVAWELTGLLPGGKYACGNAPPGTCGTLSSPTATSVTYTAPSSIFGGGNSLSLGVSACSVADSTKCESVQLSIVPPPLTVTTNSLPNGTVGTAYGPAALSASGGMTPYTWSWTAQAGSSLPPGLSIKTNNDNTGTISGIPTTAGTFNVTVTATGADGGTSQGNFAVVIAVPGKLAITTSSLSNGTVGSNYGPSGAGVVLNATGGATPYSWSWAPQGGSTRAGLPPGLNISTNNSNNTGLISGMPTQMGVFDVTVFVTDSESPAVQVAANFTIMIGAHSTCTPSGTTLCGQFTFLAQGAMGNSESPVMIAGTFFADGNGNVTTGLFDRNNGSGSGSFFNKLITGGNFKVGTDGRGSVTLSTAGPFSITFTFALNSAGTFAFLFESDDQNGAGNHVSGFMQPADSSKFNAASITGGYAMGLLGGTSAAGRPRALLIAAVSATGSDCGLSSNGNSVFINYNAGTITPSPIPFACGSGGLSSIDATMGRGTISIVLSNGPFSSQTLNFAFYIVDKTTIILISMDSVGANLPILSGTMALQIPSASSGLFTQDDLTCGYGELGNVKACILGISGESGSGSHIVVGRAKGSGHEVLDITTDENKAGVVSSQTTLGWSVVISPSGAGTLTPPASSQSSSGAFVLVTHDQAILALADGSVSFGFIHAQVELAPSATPGTFIAGTQSVANGSVPNISGIITPTGPTNGSGTLSGTLDAEQILVPPPASVEISGAAITGNYTLDSPATGRGTGGSTQPGPSSFIIHNVNVGEIVLLESDATSPQPMLIDLIQSSSPWDY